MEFDELEQFSSVDEAKVLGPLTFAQLKGAFFGCAVGFVAASVTATYLQSFLVLALGAALGMLSMTSIDGTTIYHRAKQHVLFAYRTYLRRSSKPSASARVAQPYQRRLVVYQADGRIARRIESAKE